MVFLAVTVIAAWMGYQANRAHEQRKAVAAIVDHGGFVRYDYQAGFFEEPVQRQQRVERGQLPVIVEPRGPKWMRNVIGDECFRRVDEVIFLREPWDHARTNINEPLIRHIVSLSCLERLYLPRTNIKDEQLREIASLANLKSLNLRDTRVTDSGLRHLHTMKNLEYLNVNKTHVTQQGVADLRRALPKCRVHVEEPARVNDAPVEVFGHGFFKGLAKPY
jgi:hypothetical protein